MNKSMTFEVLYREPILPRKPYPKGELATVQAFSKSHAIRTFKMDPRARGKIVMRARLVKSGNIVEGQNELTFSENKSQIEVHTDLGHPQLYCDCRSTTSNLFAIVRLNDGIYARCSRCEQEYQLVNVVEKLQEE